MSSIPHFKIVWIDRGFWPTQKPNPAYPDGIDHDMAGASTPACEVALPYPAKRIGWFLVDCTLCSFNVMISTAGRPDDPRSLRAPCKRRPLH